MSLLEQVNATITFTLTTDLSNYLADRFGLDSTEVTYTIKDYLSNNTNFTPVTKISPQSIYPAPKVKAVDGGVKKCTFFIKRGVKGNTVCGTKIRGDGDYCSKHKNRKVALTKNRQTSLQQAKSSPKRHTGTKK